MPLSLPELAQLAPRTFNAAFLLNQLAESTRGLSPEAVDESADVRIISARLRELMDSPGLSDMALREARAEYDEMNSLIITL